MLRAVRSDFSFLKLAGVHSNELMDSVNVPISFFIFRDNLSISIRIIVDNSTNSVWRRCFLIAISLSNKLSIGFWESTESWSGDNCTNEASNSTD